MKRTVSVLVALSLALLFLLFVAPRVVGDPSGGASSGPPAPYPSATAPPTVTIPPTIVSTISVPPTPVTSVPATSEHSTSIPASTPATSAPRSSPPVSLGPPVSSSVPSSPPHRLSATGVNGGWIALIATALIVLGWALVGVTTRRRD